MAFVLKILIPAWAWPLWEKVQKGPIKMSASTVRCAADVKFLLEKGLVVYEDGALRLHKDCKE